MSRTRKTYPEESKREAVPMAQKSGNRSQVAREQGVDLSSLRLKIIYAILHKGGQKDLLVLPVCSR